MAYLKGAVLLRGGSAGSGNGPEGSRKGSESEGNPEKEVPEVGDIEI